MKNVTSFPYLSGYTYRTFADFGIADEADTSYMRGICNSMHGPQLVQMCKEIQPGDIIYVTGKHVKHFLQNYVKHIEPTFNMVTAQWDAGVDQECIDLLPDNLNRWWTINAMIPHEKIVAIPLGLQNLHWGKKHNVQSDTYTYSRRKQHQVQGVMASFSVHNNPKERTDCLNAATEIFKEEDLTLRRFTRENRQDDSFVLEYFNEVSTHKYVLCPWGAGIDTHRMWEAMYLGAIPVTRRHPALEPFADLDLPIVFLDSWDELSNLNLEPAKPCSQYVSLSNPLFGRYWEHRMNNDKGV